MLPMIITKILYIFILTVNVIADENDPTIIALPDGKIRGHILESPAYKKYYAFQQIPYASAPIGDLRFKEPVAPQPWKEILNTTENTKICIQSGKATDRQTEDCLYLNVYTPLAPGNNSEDLLPVLFWIHGGGFTSGESSPYYYGPKYFIDYNVVVVTTNYRLGPFGFLTTLDDVIPGNIGLKDQNLALNWTYTNIKLFGGDSSKITIAGESAGSVAVGFQLISNKSKGLFRAAILESGTSIGPWSYQDNANYYAYQLGNALNPDFAPSNSSELLDLLNNATVSDIRNATNYVGAGLSWTPVIENDSYEGAFITGYMHEDIKNGNFNQVPIIIGFNSEEEILFIGEETAKQEAVYYDNNLESLVYSYNISDENKITAGTELRKIYTDGLFQDDFSAMVKFLSDQSFSTPAIRHADLQSNYTDVFLYQFSHKGPLGGLNKTMAGVDTVGHGEELCYLWSVHNSKINNYPVSDIVTQHRMLTLWTNFIKYLNPTPTKDVLLGNLIWPRVSSTDIRYLNINTSLEIRTNPKKYKKVKQVIDTYARPPLITY